MKWGTDKPTRYTAVSGFIFLRFFGPAILGPKLFDIMKGSRNFSEFSLIIIL